MQPGLARASSNVSQQPSIGRVNSTSSQHSSGFVTGSGPPQLNRVITGSARPKSEHKALKERHLSTYGPGMGVDVFDVGSDKWVSGTVLQCQPQRNNAGQLMGATVQVQSALGIQNIQLTNPGLNPYLRVHQSSHLSQPVHQKECVKIFSRTANAWKTGHVTHVQPGGEVVEVEYTNDTSQTALTKKKDGPTFAKNISANDPGLRTEVSVPAQPALVRVITPHSVWAPPIEQEYEARFPPKPEPDGLSPITCSQIGPKTVASAQESARKLHQQVTLQSSSPTTSTRASGGYFNAGANMVPHATLAGPPMTSMSATKISQMMSMPNAPNPQSQGSAPTASMPASVGGLPPTSSVTMRPAAGYPGLPNRSLPANMFAGNNPFNLPNRS